MVTILKCTQNQLTMLCARNYYSVIGQLYFKNKLIEKEIRFVVTRSGRLGAGGLG